MYIPSWLTKRLPNTCVSSSKTKFMASSLTNDARVRLWNPCRNTTSNFARSTTLQASSSNTPKTILLMQPYPQSRLLFFFAKPRNGYAKQISKTKKSKMDMGWTARAPAARQQSGSYTGLDLGCCLVSSTHELASSSSEETESVACSPCESEAPRSTVQSVPACSR